MFFIPVLIIVAAIAFVAYKQRANIKAALAEVDEHEEPVASVPVAVVTVPADAPVAEAVADAPKAA